MRALRILACFSLSLAVCPAQDDPQTSFPVSYVASDAVYIKAGRAAGLAEGLHLTVKRVKPGAPALDAPVVGEVVVVSIAATSAACEIRSKQSEFQVGDVAFLRPVDAEMLKMLQSSRSARKYAQVVSFTEGDPIEEEAREYVPRPPLTEVNKFRGRVSVEYGSIMDHITGAAGSQQAGLVLRADMTRIAGTYWNFTGYWRGRMNQRRSGAADQTLTDLINRTYHIGFYYNNPQSKYVAGFGRLLLPWASSLDTIDGGYLARRIGRRITSGVFGGTTPDPTSWNYARDRQMAGTFVNLETGSFETVRYSSTAGLAFSRRSWKAEREFLFFENSLLFGQKFSIFHSMQVDRLTAGRFGSSGSGPTVGRSFLTFRMQPVRWVSFDINHNHFRGIPTFDTRLLGTGQLDKFLFQGLSGGFRVELPARVALYSSLGRNKREGERSPSWNQMYGVIIGDFFDTGVRIDFRRSAFDSAFGRGSYYAATFTRELSRGVRLDIQAGKQNFRSPVSNVRRSLFLSSDLEWFVGRHYSVGAGYVVYRGGTQNYDQCFANVGYRF